MNERQLARTVCSALDESAERLPYRVARRLAAARAEALAQAKVDAPAAASTPAHLRIDRHARVRPHAPANPHATARTARRDAHVRPHFAADPGGTPPPRLVWRIAAVAVPVVVVVAGLLGISAWETQQRADDLAALDAAMLADDVPIAAYADRGFGVFLRNVSWEAERE